MLASSLDDSHFSRTKGKNSQNVHIHAHKYTKEILHITFLYLTDLELCSPILFHFVPCHLDPLDFTTSQRTSISKQQGFIAQILCPPQVNSQLVCFVAKKLIILFIL